MESSTVPAFTKQLDHPAIQGAFASRGVEDVGGFPSLPFLERHCRCWIPGWGCGGRNITLTVKHYRRKTTKGLGIASAAKSAFSAPPRPPICDPLPCSLTPHELPLLILNNQDPGSASINQPVLEESKDVDKFAIYTFAGHNLPTVADWDAPGTQHQAIPRSQFRWF